MLAVKTVNPSSIHTRSARSLDNMRGLNTRHGPAVVQYMYALTRGSERVLRYTALYAVSTMVLASRETLTRG